MLENFFNIGTELIGIYSNYFFNQNLKLIKLKGVHGLNINLIFTLNVVILSHQIHFFRVLQI